MNAIMGVNNKDKVDTLTTSDTVTYCPWYFVPIPPFLFNTVHKAIATSNGDAREVLDDSIKAVKTFDIKYQADAEYKD